MSLSREDVHLRQKDIKFCESRMYRKVPKSRGGSSWESLWMELKGHTIHVYKSTDTVQQNHVGTLTVDANSTFVVKGHDKKYGYKFRLSTGKRCNTFATEKMSERELWRAHIVGLATGKVPNDLDLLPVDVRRIQAEIDSYLCYDKRISTVTGDSGFASASGSITDRIDTQDDPYLRMDKLYSWYFGHCPREQAEKVLETGGCFGNTLMREKITIEDGRYYVISKCIWKNDGNATFEHFRVFWTKSGYKIDVQNMREEMKSLSEVMDYFVTVAGGPERTRLMETNDLKLLGLEIPDYATKIPDENPEFADNIDNVQARPSPPLPCVKRSNNTLPRPFLKANSEGQFKGLRPQNSDNSSNRSHSVDSDSKFCVGDGTPCGFGTLHERFERVESDSAQSSQSGPTAKTKHGDSDDNVFGNTNEYLIPQCQQKSKEFVDNKEKRKARPPLPLPDDATSNKTPPRPFLKANSEGQFKGLGPQKYDTGSQRSLSVDTDSKFCVDDGIPCGFRTLRGKFEQGESHSDPSTARSQTDLLQTTGESESTKQQERVLPSQLPDPRPGKRNEIKRQLEDLFGAQGEISESDIRMPISPTNVLQDNHVYAVPEDV